MERTYSLKGWSNLSRKCLVIQGSSHNHDYLDEMVTSAKEIKIYLDQGRCSTDEEKAYHQIYISNKGFTAYKIFDLIVKTFWKSVDDIYGGDSDHICDLALTKFTYNEETQSVYPDTDS